MDFVQQVIAWFADPAQWSGTRGIPARTVEHVWYALVATAAAAAIALPVGIGLGHLGRGGLLAINISNIGRAIPAFGLIVLVFILSGYGLLPVFVTLTALAVPPIVTNSYTAMRAVGTEVKEAAIGMGMTRWQRLWQAELPVALPLVLAGIRTSALQVIATATLAAFVGLGGLGRYIIDGIGLDYPQVVGGAILVALLALLVEALLAGLQALVVSRGVAIRNATAESTAKAQQTT